MVTRLPDSTIFEKAGEAIPASQHVVDRFGDGRMLGELGAFLAHPGFEFGHQSGHFDVAPHRGTKG